MKLGAQRGGKQTENRFHIESLLPNTRRVASVAASSGDFSELAAASPSLPPNRHDIERQAANDGREKAFEINAPILFILRILCSNGAARNAALQS